MPLFDKTVMPRKPGGHWCRRWFACDPRAGGGEGEGGGGEFQHKKAQQMKGEVELLLWWCHNPALAATKLPIRLEKEVDQVR